MAPATREREMTHTVTTRPPVAREAGSSLTPGPGRPTQPPWLRAEMRALYIAIIVAWIALEVAHAWRRLRLRME